VESISSIKDKHATREDLPDEQHEVKVAGRIIGRRKASSNLIFLDLESDGNQI